MSRAIGSKRHRCRIGCGRETWRDDGMCFPCSRGEPVPLPKVERLTDEQLMMLRNDVALEIEARIRRLQGRGDPRQTALALVPAPTERAR